MRKWRGWQGFWLFACRKAAMMNMLGGLERGGVCEKLEVCLIWGDFRIQGQRSQWGWLCGQRPGDVMDGLINIWWARASNCATYTCTCSRHMYYMCHDPCTTCVRPMCYVSRSKPMYYMGFTHVLHGWPNSWCSRQLVPSNDVQNSAKTSGIPSTCSAYIKI